MIRILEVNEPLPSVPLAMSGAMAVQDVDSLLAQIGANVARDASTLNMLSGATVRRGISAFLVVTVIGQNGIPLIGQKVVNQFPDGNGEVIETDGSGTARFQFGASSAFTNPGSGPFTVFLADDSAFKDSDSIPKRVVYKTKLSDTVYSLGDFGGEHTEIYLQYVVRAVVPVPPPVPTVPIIRTDEELRELAYQVSFAARAQVSYNPNAALTLVARARGLGVALASEGRYVDGSGNRWAWQAYALGIVRCLEGQWPKAEIVTY